MNSATPSFRHYHFFPEDTTSIFGFNVVTSVLEDRQAQIWVTSGIQAGVYRLNKENGSFKVYLKGASILKVIEDKQGVIWAGGGDGLFQYKPDTDSFYRFIDPVSQAEIGNIHSFIEDDEGNLWMRTVDGIIKLNRQRNAITNFSRRFGVDRNEQVYGAAYKGPAGKLYFGHVAGYYAFFPSQLTKGLKPPEVLISAFHLSNQLVLPDKKGPLTSSVYETKKIRLQHDQNVFSFDFAAIDYTYPEENRLFFMLENYDKDWHRAGSDRRAMYFNVPPGKYIFRVKAVNNSGIWAEKQIAITLLPPWWRTWWAYSLFVLLFVAIIWVIIHYRSLGLIKEKKRLEELVQLRTSEVVKQKEEISVQRDNLEQTLEELKSTQAQLIQREKMASLGELTAGIAHEIQNPLNFVSNFSEINKELIAEMKQEMDSGKMKEATAIANDIEDNEEKIRFHGKRADAIVKSMLHHSRSASGEKQPTDINALADEYLRLSYHGQRAKDKTFNATLHTDFDESISKVNVVPQDISRVLLNLFNNAFYSVHEKKKQQLSSYEPVITVSTKNHDDKIEISVYDNGLGIPKKVVDKIYQPFFTTKPTGQGTGLGLSLSYDIITKEHGGELRVETKEGEYAEFIIQLPVEGASF
jgi:signal transduction histidine kinase